MGGIRHAESLMQLRRRRRVLQEHLLIREHILGSREGRQSALVETGQNQLLLARVSVAVADRKDTGNVGFIMKEYLERNEKK